MNGYTVKQLSKLANISVRTLHHYDEIGLLKPETRTEAGYRLYGNTEVFRLQQILFYREMEFSLSEIKEILDSPDFDLIQALQFHKMQLKMKAERYEVLLKTIDKTILKLKQDNAVITIEEMYEGFSKETVEEMEEEVNKKYDPAIVEESRRRVKNLTKGQWQLIKKEAEDINWSLVQLMDKDPGSDQVQQIVERHYKWIENFYTPTEEIYSGLGSLYVSDERFTMHYDNYKSGLAKFLNEAIQIYCTRRGANI